jgi:amino acid permease
VLYWLPLVYAAVLLLVSVLGAGAGLSGSALAGVIVAATAAYLVWLALYLIPHLRKKAAKMVNDGIRDITTD